MPAPVAAAANQGALPAKLLAQPCRVSCKRFPGQPGTGSSKAASLFRQRPTARCRARSAPAACPTPAPDLGNLPFRPGSFRPLSALAIPGRAARPDNPDQFPLQQPSPDRTVAICPLHSGRAVISFPKLIMHTITMKEGNAARPGERRVGLWSRP